MFIIIFFNARAQGIEQAKYFEQILSEVDFSNNTLRQHLDKLMDKGARVGRTTVPGIARVS